jgi:hypothetical protein
MEHAQANECPLGKFDPSYVHPPTPKPKPPDPVPRDQWPLAVRVVARFKQDGEQGIGDTLARLIVGGDEFKALMEAIGVDCGCSARQAHLNALYPYADSLTAGISTA